MTVAEVADKLSRELDINVTESRIRSLESEGFVQADRTEGSDYRQFSDENIETLEKVVMLGELGINKEMIKLFLKKELNSEGVNDIINRVKAIKNFIPKILKILEEK